MPGSRATQTHGLYSYTIESTLDVSERLAETSVIFDEHGRVHVFEAPTGQHPEETISSWLIALHFGSIREGGLAYRAFVCVLGLVIAGLSITGIVIWARKWRRRRSRRGR